MTIQELLDLLTDPILAPLRDREVRINGSDVIPKSISVVVFDGDLPPEGTDEKVEV